MTKQSIQVTVVNHVAIDIAATPDAVWQVILDSFVGTKNWSDQGYRIEPLDEPAAPLGGYRMTLEKDGAVVDNRVIRISELNHETRRLSIFADYLSAPDGLQVFVTYHAPKSAIGAGFAIDCHTRMGLELPGSGTKAEVAAKLTETADQFEAHLSGYIARVKAKLEGASDGAN